MKDIENNGRFEELMREYDSNKADLARKDYVYKRLREEHETNEKFIEKLMSDEMQLKYMSKKTGTKQN